MGKSASSLPSDNNFFAASGTTNWSLSAGRIGLLGQLYNENTSGTASATGSGVESYNDSQNFSYDPVAGWSGDRRHGNGQRQRIGELRLYR